MIALALLPAVFAGDLQLGYNPNPASNEKPALVITVPRAADELYVSCQVGAQTIEKTWTAISGGQVKKVEWARDAKVTSALCYVRVIFADGMAEEMELPVEYSFGAKLSVDLSRSSADIQAHTLTVNVSARVDTAEIIAYGAGKTVLEKREIPVNAGPGKITIPWAGDASEVVLLDVTVRSGESWAGFTFSPWFLNIPHEDVLFDSNSDVINASEEYKLRHSLEELNDVLAKYGDIVQVKLYIAGCTDTMGDSASNLDLSRRRAKAIASWLRKNGYSGQIYYYGFGEGLPAVNTGDSVNEAKNRRALYLVGAAAPPAGSGIPSVNWVEL